MLVKVQVIVVDSADEILVKEHTHFLKVVNCPRNISELTIF